MTVDSDNYVIAFHSKRRFGLVGIGQWGWRDVKRSRAEGESEQHKN
jgi:hypothetical protein